VDPLEITAKRERDIMFDLADLIYLQLRSRPKEVKIEGYTQQQVTEAERFLVRCGYAEYPQRQGAK
jgi:hypothetical protein